MKLPYLTLLLTLISATIFAQFQNILIHEAGNNAKEPAIAINLANTNELVAGANGDNVYYSHDGGYSWSLGKLVSSYGVLGDPCVVADDQGNFYYSHLSKTETPTGWLDRIVIQKSTDAGISWNNGSFTGFNDPKDQDKPWLAFDTNPLSPFYGNLYVAWTEFDTYGSSDPQNQSRILCSVSHDGAGSWDGIKMISERTGDCVDSDHTAEGAVPAIGPNGEVYLSWSLDDTIWFDRSLDGGKTWLDEDILVGRQPGGWNFNVSGIYRCNGFPITACDQKTGTIYINWSDQRLGENDTDIYLSKSEDGGNTWSKAKRVNDDPPGRHNFFTWMAIDQTTGVLYFVFYDRRNHDDWKTDVYLAYSTDEGETFMNLKISEEPFVPQPNKFFGDYTNITAHDGHVHPIWARMDDGETSVWTAVSDSPNSLESPDFFGLKTKLHNYPNPFSEATTIVFNLSVEQQLSLAVFDVTGKWQADIFQQKKFTSGVHEFTLDNREVGLPAGLYFLKLDNGLASEVCKVVVGN
jgi:hypothetical protein